MFNFILLLFCSFFHAMLRQFIPLNISPFVSFSSYFTMYFHFICICFFLSLSLTSVCSISVNSQCHRLLLVHSQLHRNLLSFPADSSESLSSTIGLPPYDTSVMIYQNNAILSHKTAALVSLLHPETCSLFKDYWVFLICPSSGILNNTKEHNVSDQ